MMRLLPRFLVVALLLFIDSIHSASLAQDKFLKKINWGVTSLSGGNWIPWDRQGSQDLRETWPRCSIDSAAGFRADFSGAPGRQHFRFAGCVADGDAHGLERCRPYQRGSYRSRRPD